MALQHGAERVGLSENRLKERLECRALMWRREMFEHG